MYKKARHALLRGVFHKESRVSEMKQIKLSMSWFPREYRKHRCANLISVLWRKSFSYFVHGVSCYRTLHTRVYLRCVTHTRVCDAHTTLYRLYYSSIA